MSKVYQFMNNLYNRMLNPKYIKYIEWCKTINNPHDYIWLNNLNPCHDSEWVKNYIVNPLSGADKTINENSYISQKQQLVSDVRWEKLQDKYPFLFNTISHNEYIKQIAWNFYDLMNEHNIIGIPGDVFGYKSDNTIISCLNNDHFIVSSNFNQTIIV